MRPEELAQFRSEAGLTQKQFAELLNRATGRRYSSDYLAKMERGKIPISAPVEEAILGLQNLGKATDLQPGQETPEYVPADVPPKQPEITPQAPLVPHSGGLEAATTEVFMGVGGGLVIFAQFSNSQVLRIDGEIIQADAKALGAAYAKLAEQNAWVKRILLSLSSGGAWVEVVMVTLVTGGKLVSNHRQYADWLRAQQASVPAADNGGQVIDGSPVVEQQ